MTNGLFTLIEIRIAAAQRSGGSSQVSGILLDFLAGIVLLAGRKSGRLLGLLRIFLAVVFGGVLAVKREYLLMFFQLLFSASLALLITGRPGKQRIVTAVAMVGTCFLLACVGLYAEVTGAMR